MRKVRRLFSSGLLFLALYLLLLAGGFALLFFLLPNVLKQLILIERALAFLAAFLIASSFLPSEKKERKLFLLFFPFLWPIGLFPLKEKNFRPLQKYYFEDEILNAAANFAAEGCKISPCRAERADFLKSGKEFCEKLLLDLKEAKGEILFDFYLLSHGVCFDPILSVLEQKAKEGLDVSLIFDGFGCAPSLGENFSALLRKKGIKAKVYHPMRSCTLFGLNMRDHRKLAIIDREIVYLGGVNLSDEYIGETIKFGHWKDGGIRLIGEPAERFSALFRKRSVEKSPKEEGIPCVAFGDEKRNLRVGEEIYNTLFSAAKKTLYLCTPYLVPSDRLLSSLKSAAKRADVRILIPHIPDKRSIFCLTRAYARELISAGVKVREYTAGFLHQKSLTMDKRYALMGSYNLDERSMKLQAECGALLSDRALCFSIDCDFLSAWEMGSEVPKATKKEALCARLLRPASLFL